jgi:hypothetical protein
VDKQHIFTLYPDNDLIWNQQDLLEFLIANQGKDIVLNTNQEGPCLTSAGLYKFLDLFEFKSVTIETANLVEYHPKYQIKIDNRLHFLKLTANTVDSYQQYHIWNKEKIFGLIYNRPSWHRIGLASVLQSNYADRCLLNFRADPTDEDGRKLFDLQKLFVIDPESTKKFINTQENFPLLVNDIDEYLPPNLVNVKVETDGACRVYPTFFIDLVAETFTSGRCFFPTEKIIRPMLLKKPFIVMGSKDFLLYLRQLGFKTFYQYWDEVYDAFDEKERYCKILNLIHELVNKPITELNDMYASMQPILDHNYDLLRNQTYTKEIKYVE